MYDSFVVKNFRCLANLSIKNLERINLIAGKNGIGKTALLEAFWLHHAPNVPDLARRVNVFRGIPQIEVDSPFWDLFAKFDPDSKIELKSYGSWGKQPRILNMYLEERREVEVKTTEPALSESSVERSSLIRPSRYQIVFEYIDESNKEFKSLALPVERQISAGLVELG